MTGTVALIRKVTARHFRAGGVDVTADQLADQIIPSMRAVAGGQIMSALPPKADITEGYEKCPLMTQSGHRRGSLERHGFTDRQSFRCP